jgi:hypothetical protein
VWGTPIHVVAAPQRATSLIEKLEKFITVVAACEAVILAYARVMSRTI